MAIALILPGAIAIGLSLGMLGAGGSIVTVPVFRYLIGQDEKLAIASSLAVVAIIAAAGAASYLRERLVDWRRVWLFGVPGMLGTYIGAWSSSFVAGAVQLAVFSLVMALAAYFMLRPLPEVSSSAPRPGWAVGADGLLVGALTGFVGVGGGFLIIPALVLLGGMSMHKAIGTSLVIIVLKSAVGFLTYQQVLAGAGLEIDYAMIGFVAGVGVIGSIFGSLAGQALSKSLIQKVFAWSLIVLALGMLGDSLLGLL